LIRIPNHRNHPARVMSARSLADPRRTERDFHYQSEYPMPPLFTTTIGLLKRRYAIVAASLLVALTCVGAYADPSVGTMIHNVDVDLIDGKLIQGRQLQGKVVIYLFWATWCPICTSELPAYDQLHTRFRGKGLEILAISLDQYPETVSAFQEEHDYELPMAMRTATLRQMFGPIKGTPTVFLVDRGGVVRLKHLGVIDMGELEKQIRKIL
jgi:cytochrome c biogenesis protein CcmG, thiol:disulfide interchange protein DsbE